MTVARAILMLGLDNARRMLREGLVLRSLVWPGLLVACTLAGVLGLLAWLRVDPIVAVGPDVSPAAVQALEDAGLTVLPVDDPSVVVLRGEHGLATDGVHLWERGSKYALAAEIALRDANDAPWTPRSRPLAELEVRTDADVPKLPDDAVVRVLSLLFSLYGLVFGLGAVARDRDAGILDAELCLPVPRWATGFARWASSGAVLTMFLGLSVAVVTAVLPARDPLPALVHGVAATLTSVAVGMAVVGRAGLRAGFSGPFGLGMTITTAAASLGWRFDLPWLPVASLFSSRPGWVALAGSLLAGVVGSVVFARRSGGPS